MKFHKSQKSSIIGFFVEFSGEIRINDNNSFGFVNDIFISPDLVSQYNLANGLIVNGWAIKQINKKRNELAWKALCIEKIN